MNSLKTNHAYIGMWNDYQVLLSLMMDEKTGVLVFNARVFIEEMDSFADWSVRLESGSVISEASKEEWETGLKTQMASMTDEHLAEIMDKTMIASLDGVFKSLDS